MRQDNKILFAIYSKKIHLGNSYGKTERNAIKRYLLSSYSIQISNITIEEVLKLHSVDDFSAIKAIPKIHYFESKYLNKDRNDQDYITFTNKGELICGTQLSAYTWEKLNINPNAKNRMRIYPEKRENYLEFHRNYVFQDNINDLI